LTDDRVLLALAVIGLAILLVAGAAALMLREMAARDLEQRVVSLANVDGAVLGSPSALGGMHRLLSWIGATVRGSTKLYSDRDLMVLEGMISGTGFNPRTVLPLVLGAKVVLAIGIPLVAILYARFMGLSGGQQFLTLCIAIPLGLLGPDWVLTLLRRPYLAALRRGVPDALDLLVVCTEAGMALENALEHVGQEIRHSNPAISVALGKLRRDAGAARSARRVPQFRRSLGRGGGAACCHHARPVDAVRHADQSGAAHGGGGSAARTDGGIGGEGGTVAGAAGTAVDFVHHAVAFHSTGGSRDVAPDGFTACRDHDALKGPTMSCGFGKSALLAAALCALLSGCAQPPGGEADKQNMNADSRLRVALAAEQSGDRDLAISMYVAAAEQAPNDAAVLQRCAEGLARSGRLDEAAALLKRHMRSGVGRPDLMLTLGSIEVLAGQPVQADATLSEVLAARPDDVKALTNRGIALDMEKRHAEAQVLYRKALALAPGDVAISNDLALSLMLWGHSDEARTVLLPFRDVANLPERVRINLGIVEAAGGDHAGAQQLLSGSVNATDLAALTQAIQLRATP
jgi:Flp pilus assembly protein TadD